MEGEDEGDSEEETGAGAENEELALLESLHGEDEVDEEAEGDGEGEAEGSEHDEPAVKGLEDEAVEGVVLSVSHSTTRLCHVLHFCLS